MVSMLILVFLKVAIVQAGPEWRMEYLPNENIQLCSGIIIKDSDKAREILDVIQTYELIDVELVHLFRLLGELAGVNVSYPQIKGRTTLIGTYSIRMILEKLVREHGLSIGVGDEGIVIMANPRRY